MKKIQYLIQVVIFTSAISYAGVTVDGQQVKVIDPHLHSGKYSQMNTAGKEFIMETLPDISKLYAPATMSVTLDAYAPNSGISGQLEMANIDMAFLLATYTHHTSGYFTNEQLLEVLTDERNVTQDGSPLFLGLASINFDDFETVEVREERLDSLSCYFQNYPELFIGIKLAHAHQLVAFNDPLYYGVYKVAERFSVPVLLHTGFSPFPGSSVDPSAYDPIYLTDVIKAYDGLSGRPLVEFVLAHSGQGDMRSVHHALEICRDNPNVYIDISALKRGFLIDIDGNQIPEADQIDSQLPYILEKIKTFGIIDRTLFATDGPQYPGMVAGYLSLCIEEMKSANFTLEEIEKVLYSNTCDLFLKE